MEESTPNRIPIRETLRKTAWFTLAAGALFLAGVLFGVVRPDTLGGQLDSLRAFAETLQDQSAFSLGLLIFTKNSVAALISLLTGPLLGVFPAYSALLNGAVVGAVLQAEPGSAWMLLPHGIFELPAMFLAWGMGIWTGAGLFAKPERLTTGKRFRSMWPVYVRVVLPLLFAAAILEAALISLFPHA